MIVTNVRWDAVDAGSADNERCESVRQRRVVLTPRGWRSSLLRSKLLRGDGGNKPVTREITYKP